MVRSFQEALSLDQFGVFDTNFGYIYIFTSIEFHAFSPRLIVVGGANS